MQPVPEWRLWKPSKKEIRKFLRDRDGNECWFCGKIMGQRANVEHLIPVSHGGPDCMSNKVLAHPRCNRMAGNKPLVAKIALRESMRAQRAKSTD